jgi:hypothetical protein
VRQFQRKIIKTEEENKPKEKKKQRLTKKGYLLNERKRYLHRDIYKRHHGSIPGGYHIHHIDLCKTNNDIGNLIAIPEGLHMILHREIDMGRPYIDRPEIERRLAEYLQHREDLSLRYAEIRQELEDAYSEQRAIKRRIKEIQRRLSDLAKRI